MSNCSCVFVDLCGALPQFHRATEPVARKEYHCDECGRAIKPGDKYEYVVGKWEGEMSVHRTCASCLEIRNAMFCEGYIYRQLWQDLAEHIACVDGNIGSECFVGMTSGSRDRICDAVQDYWNGLEE